MASFVDEENLEKEYYDPSNPIGHYTDPRKFMSALNNFPDTAEHFRFKINDSGFTTIKRICNPPK
ncbi:Protein of unknown function, partial [Cotesia congregata]